ncbi:MAG: MOSC domain-containing protein [Deltaproteobacteria bacterium]|jgi:uncharacterized protein YcbX|nr:MOSC domain-containing protein [Deltaproteobacteria bacterium]MBW2500447.1 MOSC domain-containing protein [Deltaproteobacteria bacterium]
MSTPGPVIGELRALHRYPVKSMAGESIAESRVEPRLGLRGDRAWAVRDLAAGEIRGAKKIPGLLDCRARYVGEPQREASAPIELHLGDLGRIRSDEAGASERLSQRIGRELLLCPRAPASETAHYLRAESITDMEAEIRKSSELLPDESLPSMDAAPEEIREMAHYVSPPGTYFDFFDLHLLSLRSLASLATRTPDSVIDPRRFRPNLLVDLEAPSDADDDWPEIGWVGRTLAIGEAELEVVMPMMRCVMTTHAQQGLPKDPTIMRTLVRECDMSLGIGIQVRRGGLVRSGDEIRVLKD